VLREVRVTFWLTLIGMVAVTFGSRLAGLTLRVELPAFWLRFLHFVPIAVFAALVTPSLQGTRGEGEIRIAAAAVVAVAAWRTRNLAIALLAGLTVFWLLRVPF
jgi:branched-subunit amino acid transport protein